MLQRLIESLNRNPLYKHSFEDNSRLHHVTYCYDGDSVCAEGTKNSVRSMRRGVDLTQELIYVAKNQRKKDVNIKVKLRTSYLLWIVVEGREGQSLALLRAVIVGAPECVLVEIVEGQEAVVVHLVHPLVAVHQLRV